MSNPGSASVSTRIGIDWGGTKIEVLAIDREGRELRRERVPTPRYDYEGSIRTAAALVFSIEQQVGETCTIGVGIPGMIDPKTDLVRNANSTWLNGKPLECIEGWISGPGLEDDYRQSSGISASGPEIVRLGAQGDPEARASLDRYEDRLARALAHMVNLLDPDVIVLGGGLSQVKRLYDTVPARIGNYVFGKIAQTPVCPAKHGDSSGVRGAARLWPLDKDEERDHETIAQPAVNDA